MIALNNYAYEILPICLSISHVTNQKQLTVYMKNLSFNPFLHYSEQLQDLLTKASSQENPAYWLYKHDARTSLFMLEALTRLHNKAFDEKLFDKWNKRFKKLEDLLGQIDLYDSLGTEFKKNKKIPKDVIKYFTVNVANYSEKCNQRLREKDWLGDKMKSFNYKLSEFAVEYNREYADELKFAMRDELDAILNFGLKYNYEFTKVEEQVHELRRKLRWISIYAQALQGLVQLKKSEKKKAYEIKYFTKDILGSAFNKLPAQPKNVSVIEFDSNSFYALSWLINQLGALKDSALKAQFLKDALYISENVSEAEAKETSLSILGYKKTLEADVLKEASKMLKTSIVKDKILDHLIL